MADEKGDAISLINYGASTSSSHNYSCFEPTITLPELSVTTLEEGEVQMLKMHAKLFRYDTSESSAEWKDRGIGDMQILRHTEKNYVRVVMRRDQTFQICANHYVTPSMELKSNCGSDRAWVYSVPADFADEEVRSQLLAIKFATAEDAKKWKEIFEDARKIVEKQCELHAKKAKSKEEDDRKHESEEQSEAPDNAVNEEEENITEDSRTGDKEKEMPR